MSKPMQLVPKDGVLTIIPPNEDMLAIARLYLEKYEVLELADRALFREIVATFNRGGLTKVFDSMTPLPLRHCPAGEVL